MMSKSALIAFVALIPGIAFAADTSTSVPAAGSAIMQAAPAVTATADSHAKAMEAKTDAAATVKAVEKGKKTVGHPTVKKTSVAKAAPASLTPDSPK